MKTHDFINSIIGDTVYISGDGDLGFYGEFRKLMYNKCG